MLTYARCCLGAASAAAALALFAVALAALPGCEIRTEGQIATAPAVPSSPVGGPSGVRYSRTTLGVGIFDRDELITIEVDGRRHVFLQVAGTGSSAGGRALVRVSETPIAGVADGR